jgi:hypothetical protein
MHPDPKWLRDILETGARFQRLFDSSDFAAKSAELHRAMDNSAVAELHRAMDNSAFADLSRALNNPGVADLARRIDESNRVVADLLKPSPIISLSGAALAHAMDSSVQQLLAASISGSRFASLINDIEAVWPIVEQYRTAVEQAPDESTKRSAFQNAGRALFKGATEREWRLDTFEGRYELLGYLLYIMLTLAYQIYAQSQQDAKLELLERTQQDQVRIIAALAETVREIQQEQEREHRQHQPTVLTLLKVTNDGTLRDAPSSNAQRVARVHAGDTLEHIVRVGRWYYVEVLTREHDRTGVRGWVYRRVVRQTE